MIRVLHIMGCSDYGGISTVVLNYYQHIDRSKIHFDIALVVPTVGHNAKELEKLGAKIYFLPLKKEGIRAFQKALRELIAECRPDVIHTHEGKTAYIALRVAKKMGVKGRIAHAHTSAPVNNLSSELKRLSGILLNYHYATAVIGCGRLAGERVFGKINMKRKKAFVLPNAVDTARFSFDETVRETVRAQLGLSDRFVIGMVGRLSEEKNHLFALRLMKQLHKQNPSVSLLIVGDGGEEDRIAGLIEKNQMASYVRLLGRRLDMDRLYQVFDCLLLPSFHEGFPVTAVEAMASGLPVLLSDTITRELAFGSEVRYLPLKQMSSWIEGVEDLIKRDSISKRIERQGEPALNGLDIHSSARRLEEIYQKTRVTQAAGFPVDSL